MSQRLRPDGFGRQPGYVAFTEAEDVLASCADADLVMIDHGPSSTGVRARRIAGRAMRRMGRPDASLPPIDLPGRTRAAAVRPPRHHYDLVVFIGFTLWDLPLLEQAHEACETGDRIVAWFPEAWASELDDERLRYEPYGMANALFVGMRPAAERLDAATSVPVHYLPPAVDVRRFGAGVADGPRPVDVLGIGRRDHRLHRHLLDWSRKSSRYYVYDTISGSQVTDPTAHRENLGDMYWRTNVALTNFAKYDMPEVTQGRREIPGRFWEALASGAIMAGFAPCEEEQIALTGESLVHDLPADATEAAEIVAELVAKPDQARRRRQMQLALQQHDWAHRWAMIFESVGLDLPPRLRARLDQLAELSAVLD